jgi:hypothetical protein
MNKHSEADFAAAGRMIKPDQKAGMWIKEKPDRQGRL